MLKRAAIVGVVLVVAVVLLGAGTLTWLTVRAHPETSGVVEEPALREPVTVRRDAYGIAHITAATPTDLFYAQGWVHASERMWQMEVWRHISSGRLSELFGAGELDTDRFIRTLDWRGAAERDRAAVSPATRVALDGYARGVNAWLDEHRGSLGIPFVMAGAEPEPWTDLDTLAWGKVQAWNLGGNLETEIFRMLADAQLGDPARTDDLLTLREDAPVITATGAPGSGGSGGAAAGSITSAPAEAGSPAVPTLSDDQAAAWRALGDLAGSPLRIAGLDGGDALASDHGIGSNDWVVGPTLSATGGALLANDPHLGISMPSIWFINGLHCTTVDAACPYDVAGVSFPGVPGVVLGHNARIAWGATNVDPDVQDLVIETVDPADPSRYIAPDGSSQPFTTRDETIAVSGGDPVTLTVRETSHGPILNDVDSRLAGAPPMALRWTGIHPAAGPDGTLDAILALNVAADYDDFRDALATYQAPAQNFVYADVDGHIGYQLPGKVPVRTDPTDRGLRPVRGDDGSGEWTGFIPYDDLPRQLDPTEGMIVTANNAAVDDRWPDFIGAEWDPGYRAERIIDQVSLFGEGGIDLEEMSSVQTDTAPTRAMSFVFRLAQLDPPATPDGVAVHDAIVDWDGACTTDSVGCAAYMTWEYHLQRRTFDDELGPLARDYVGSPWSWTALERFVRDEVPAPWWDDTTTPGIETADGQMLAAMDAAGADLRATLGDPPAWRWGVLHTATFAEQTLGTSGIAPLETYMNRGPVEVPGAAGAVNNTYYQLSRGYPDPDDPESVPVGLGGLFTVTNLPSYRLLIDMGDIDGARIVITTGQSGNPFHAHYDDQIDPWRTGQTLPFPFTAAAVAAATVDTLTLQP